MILNDEGNLIFSASPDGTVRVWNNSCNDGLFFYKLFYYSLYFLLMVNLKKTISFI
jgi:hypothetical protein